MTTNPHPSEQRVAEALGRRGYFVVSYFRLSRDGMPPDPYIEVERKWYPWKWWANLAAKPRMFISKLAPGEFGFIRTDVIPALLSNKDQ